MRVVVQVVRDSLVSLAMRPLRAVLTAFGAMVGVAALVSVVGLTSSAGAQIVQRFDAAASTAVVLEPSADGADGGAGAASGGVAVLAWGDAARLAGTVGVVAASPTATVPVDIAVRTIAVDDPAAAPTGRVPVIASDAGILGAVDARLLTGRAFDVGHVTRGDDVVLVGVGAARRLGITDLDRTGVLFLDERPFRVVGIFAGDAAGELLDALVVPWTTAAERFGAGDPDRLLVRTERGSTSAVADRAPLELHPEAPGLLIARFIPDPAALRAQIGADTRALFLVVGGVCLVAGAVGITNTMLVSVLERTREIGVRRAVGARRGDVVLQFLTESAVLGVLGGVLGSACGAFVVVAGSLAQGWTPVADWRLFPLGVLLGGVTGVLAGVVPAWRAARIEPALALRAS